MRNISGCETFQQGEARLPQVASLYGYSQGKYHHDGVDGTQTSATQMRPPVCRPMAISKNFHFSCCTPKKTFNHSSAVEAVGELIFQRLIIKHYT